MSKYEIRYTSAAAPGGTKNTREVEAAFEQVEDDFVVFYAESSHDMGGRPIAKGGAIHRVKVSDIIEVRKVS